MVLPGTAASAGYPYLSAAACPLLPPTALGWLHRQLRLARCHGVGVGWGGQEDGRMAYLASKGLFVHLGHRTWAREYFDPGCSIGVLWCSLFICSWKSDINQQRGERRGRPRLTRESTRPNQDRQASAPKDTWRQTGGTWWYPSGLCFVLLTSSPDAPCWACELNRTWWCTGTVRCCFQAWARLRRPVARATCSSGFLLGIRALLVALLRLSSRCKAAVGRVGWYGW